ncbi:tRNA (guanine(46)-N(7))-methyltransferase TrmB [Chondromyces crocatus]|uniref:tRNA (guanine-N(7)-)-methyltransferase n=1 Tax=Chondromyces crocatus TaxID=52 RepID=A0A0K1EA15_CHOCO|nr:tRNA (guanine-N(7)-)-methyltransferase [Chondromyces crocatus]AKT37705.1 tRNA (guanine-N7-)-methyltransferase [Chondromyces crocatus]
MAFQPRPNHPYAHAARFPEGKEVNIDDLFRVPRSPLHASVSTEASTEASSEASAEASAEVGAVDAVPSGPVEIEVGPGRGGFLFERAVACPQARLVGLEIRLKWSAIVDDRLRKRGFGARVRALNADAREALRRLRPDGSVARFYLHFPDPWWKKKHQKRLVMSPDLLDEMARLLEDGGELFVQTDVEERAGLYAAQIGAHAAFEPAGDQEGAPELAENPYGARSPREHRAIEDGLPVTRLRYRRRVRG